MLDSLESLGRMGELSDFERGVLDTLELYGRRLHDLETQEFLQPGVPGAGGGRVKLRTQTLSATTSTVTFASIDQTYSHLEYWCLLRSPDAVGHQSLAARFNSDTGSNYEWTTRSSSGPSGSHPWLESASTSDTFLRTGLFAGGTDTGAVGAGMFRVLFYSDTNFYTITNGFGGVIQESGTDPRSVIDVGSGAWRSTAAVTSIEFQLIPAGAIDLAANTVFIEYGIT